MNEGVFGYLYGPVIAGRRVHYKAGQGASQYLGEAVVIGTCDDISGQTSRSKGQGSAQVDRTDLVLQVPITRGPKGVVAGAGAILAQVPDGGVAGGNQRGVGAVDLQVSRALATQVASGSYAVAIGYSSTASGSYAVAIGDGNTASGSYAVAIGDGSTASGSYAVAIGYSSTAGVRCMALGYNTTASGTAGVVLGSYSDAASYGLATGYYASTQAISGKRAHSSGALAVAGEVQTAYLQIYAATTGATPTALRSNTSAASAANQVILPNSSAYAFDGIIIARQKAGDGTAAAAWQVSGLIRREANAASTVLVASTVTAISNVPGWTLALTADTTNGGLKVEFTGAAATNIRVCGTIRTSELTYV